MLKLNQLLTLFMCFAALIGCAPAAEPASGGSTSLNDIPAYAGDPYVVVNDNQPDFNEDDLTTNSFELYSDLDALGRCGVAYANVGQDIMPTEKRESISSVKPTGWVNKDYDKLVDGGYLYNRCHLIGFQLTGENANEKNLITGTRYLNVEGMLPFENMVADYVKETNNHVLYRVTPVFEGSNLVASG
ncbi:MAG: DNA/RNA non-specific endonuclease, partial [Butyricicoccus sp.]